MERGGVGVIVVNWNGGLLLGRCLDCLMKQTCPPGRILVVDNASSDGSIDAIRSKHPQVEVVRLDRNEGFARANNIGVRGLPDCRWIALLNPDAFPEPGWLEALTRAADAHPECASFGSHMRMADVPGRLDGIGDVYHVSGTAWRERHRWPDDGGDETPREIFSACAAAALYRRDVFVEAGAFDESYFCYFEDVDLGFRIRLLGYRSLYVPDAIVSHTGSASFGKASEFAVYHGNRNLVWTYVKNMPLPLLLQYLPQHVLWNVVSLCLMPFRRAPWAVARSKWDALLGLPTALRSRTAVQGTRRASIRELRKAMSRGLFTPYVHRLRRRRWLDERRVVTVRSEARS